MRISAVETLGEAAGPRLQTVDGEYTGIDIIRVGNATYAYAASAQGDALAVFSISPDGIALKGQIGGANPVHMGPILFQSSL